MRVAPGTDGRPADRFSTIGEALAAARTGALISVRPGTYAENLVIHTRVTLTAAEGRGTVEIRPRSGSVVALRADAVMFSELTLRGGDAELPAVDVRRGQAAFDGCEIVGAAWTAMLVGGTGSLALRDCRVSNPQGAGVVVTSTTPTTVESCTLEHLGTSGIVLAEQGEARVRDCTVRGARGNGLLANGETRGTVEDCDISSTDKPSIALEENAAVSVVRTVVHDTSTGVHLSTGGRSVLEDVRVTGASGNGIVLAMRHRPRTAPLQGLPRTRARTVRHRPGARHLRGLLGRRRTGRGPAGRRGLLPGADRSDRPRLRGARALPGGGLGPGTGPSGGHRVLARRRSAGRRQPAAAPGPAGGARR